MNSKPERKGTPLVNIYLLLYNTAQTLGWVYILLRVLYELKEFKLPENSKLWNAISFPLQIFQYGALLEIIHAATGLVRSPMLATLLQVFSRVALVIITSLFPALQGDFAVCTMALSWCLVEVPRYLFYALNLLNRVPFWLLWIRYSAFIVLYPSGVSSELRVVYKALEHANPPLSYLFMLAFAIYLPFAPYLYYHMVVQRRKNLVTSKPKDQ